MAVVAFLNTNTMGHGTTSFSGAMTINASSNLAVACISFDHVAGLSPNTVTYGGQAMTAAGAVKVDPTGKDYVVLYYKINPLTGSNTMAVTMTGTSSDVYVGLTGFSGVNSATPVRAGTYTSKNTMNSGGTTISLTVTSNTNDLTVTCVNGGDVAAVTTTNQTGDGTQSSGISSAGIDHATTAAASVTHTWTEGVSGGSMTIVGMSLDGDVSAPTTKSLFFGNPL